MKVMTAGGSVLIRGRFRFVEAAAARDVVDTGARLHAKCMIIPFINVNVDRYGSRHVARPREGRRVSLQ
jgi:hypothetical protein